MVLCPKESRSLKTSRLSVKTTQRLFAVKVIRWISTTLVNPAMEAFEARLPDLVVIDINLKDEVEGGFELCQIT